MVTLGESPTPPTVDARERDLPPPNSEYALHLLSACCVPDPLLSPRRGHCVSILHMGNLRHKIGRGIVD